MVGGGVASAHKPPPAHGAVVILTTAYMCAVHGRRVFTVHVYFMDTFLSEL